MGTVPLSLPWRSHLAGVFPFHDMAPYELSSCSIDFSIFYKLETHVVSLTADDQFGSLGKLHSVMRDAVTLVMH
jgi:hypothetical protein